MHLWVWIIFGAVAVLGAWLSLYPMTGARRWQRRDKAPRPPRFSREEQRRRLLIGLPIALAPVLVGAAVGVATTLLAGRPALGFALGILGAVIVLVAIVVVALVVTFRDELRGKGPPSE